MAEQTPVEKRPKVSILMITYNHEKFIEQAVRSVMMQETDFDYELVIGEDCSTDKTREIVMHLKEEFPDKIRLILQPENVGANNNFITVYNSAFGEYIALCEGDDYWTHPKKLQIQLDYMEAHRECSTSFHATDVYSDTNVKLRQMRPPVDAEITVKNWLRHGGDYIATNTLMFRHPSKPLPAWYHKLSVTGDWPLIMWLDTFNGSLSYIEGQSLSVYRKHPGGVAFDRTTHQLTKLIDDFELVIDELPTYWSFIVPIVASLYIQISEKFNTAGDNQRARKYFWKSIRYYKEMLDYKHIKKWTSMFMRLYLPRLHQMYLIIRYSELSQR